LFPYDCGLWSVWGSLASCSSYLSSQAQTRFSVHSSGEYELAIVEPVQRAGLESALSSNSLILTVYSPGGIKSTRMHRIRIHFCRREAGVSVHSARRCRRHKAYSVTVLWVVRARVAVACPSIAGTWINRKSVPQVAGAEKACNFIADASNWCRKRKNMVPQRAKPD
jgi:hypothetical protein